MTTLIAKVKNGRIDLPPEFPEGSDVSVTLRPVEEPLPTAGKTLGYASDEEYGTDPESIEKWIADFKAIHAEPDSGKAYLEIQQILRENKEWELAHAAERERKLGFS